MGGIAPYWVQPPSVSRIAGPSSISPPTGIERVVAVELRRGDEVGAQLPRGPVARLGVADLERLALARGLSTGLKRIGNVWPGRAVGDAEHLVLTSCAACEAGSSAPIGAAVIE